MIRTFDGAAGEVAFVWVIVTVCPATVNVPVLDAVVVFAATPYVTVPLPVPLAPAVTANQAVLVVAVHEQPDVVVTVRVPVPPAGAAFAEVGVTVKAQGAACVIVTVWPATVSVPVREVVPVFAATL